MHGLFWCKALCGTNTSKSVFINVNAIMKTEVKILAGINNLKTQLKKVMTEASTLEVMIREMESSLNGVDNDRACGNEPLLPMSLDFS